MRGKVLLSGLFGLVLVFGNSCGDDDTTPTVDSGVVTADSTPTPGDTGMPDTATADGPAADGPTADTTTTNDGSTSVSFSTGVQPIFTASCAGASCHAGAAPKAGLNLSSGSAYAQLVGAASLQCSSLKRVEPGSPDQSYLVQKVEGAGSCFSGQKMPVGGSLGTAEISSIKSWITAGAKND